MQFLLLIRVEDRSELSEKGLLCLGDLLLQRVDLDHQYADLCRVCARIQQNAQLLNQGLRFLKWRYERCLARLQQLLQLAHLTGAQLQESSHDLQRRCFFGARCRLQLLQYLIDVQFR